MGLINDLIGANQQKKASDTQRLAGMYSTIFKMDDEDLFKAGQDPKAMKSAALDNLMGLYEKEGGKQAKQHSGPLKGVLSVLSGMGSALRQMNPLPAAPKPRTPLPKAGAPPDEASVRAYEAKEAERTALKQSVANKQAAQDTLTAEELRRLQYIEGQNAEVAAGRKTREDADEAINTYTTTGRPPTTATGNIKDVYFDTPNGEVHLRERHDGKFINLANRVIPIPDDWKQIDKPTGARTITVKAKGTDPGLQAWAKEHGAEIDPKASYTITRAGKQIISATEAPDTKGSGLTGTLKEEIEARNIVAHPGEHETWEVAQAQEFLKQKNMPTVIAATGLPGAFGTYTPPPPGSNQTPMMAMTPQQRDAVRTAENALSGATSAGIGGQAMRNRINAGINLISDATGVPTEELNARSERRKAAKASYTKIKNLTSSVEGLENALNRHGIILGDARDKLPDTVVAKFNGWLISGLGQWNTGGMSKDAVNYGIALQAVRNEYARVISGGAASAGQIPVEAMREAGNIMSSGFSAGNMRAMIKQIKTETTQRTGGYKEELKQLYDEISQPVVPELRGKAYKGVEQTPLPGEGGGDGGQDRGNMPPPAKPGEAGVKVTPDDYVERIRKAAGGK